MSYTWREDAVSLSLGTVMILVGGAAFSVIIPIVWPRIISHPWPTYEDDKGLPGGSNPSKENTTVILAGSYNPPHLGHLAMIEYLATRYKNVIAVLGMNPNKKYLVSPNERKELLETMLLQSPLTASVRVEVVSGYIWRFARAEGASIFFRGIRSWEKDGKEERQLQILNTWGPMLLGFVWPLQTIYLEGNPEFNHISSTLIRSIACANQVSPPTSSSQKAAGHIEDSLKTLVPPTTVNRVIELYSRSDGNQ